jgi:hypothetical protein
MEGGEKEGGGDRVRMKKRGKNIKRERDEEAEIDSVCIDV